MNEKTIRAWKDRSYRATLNDAERASIMENPAGFIELSDAELGFVAGADCFDTCVSCGQCPITLTCDPTQ